MGTIRQALILAAGRGRAVGDPETPNCLAPVGGVPLLLRWLRLLTRFGVTRIGIAVGWQRREIRRQVQAMLYGAVGGTDPNTATPDPEILFFENDRWEGPNGLSVLAARSLITEPTLLVMADQIAAPRLVGEFLGLSSGDDQTIVGIDRDLSRVFDYDDATKVRLAAESTPDGHRRVEAIGKNLPQPDALSTGLFVMAPSLVRCLESLPEPSLTEGVALAAEQGLVVGRDVAGSLWQDVDSPEMRLHAEWLLRVYGDELAQPSVAQIPRSSANDTLALIEQLLADKNLPGYTLFNPGPVMTSARIKASLVHHDVCHRDEDYCGVVRRLQAKLRPVFGASEAHEMLLLTGSGTAAMEMAISSVVPVDKSLLTIASGAFGERLGEIATLHGISHQILSVPWGEVPDPEAVATALDADPKIAVVAMIHHETSVGVVNPVGAIGAVCHARGVLLVVDAVSSLGVEDIDVVRDHVDICYSSANKCLHSISGVSFLCVAPTVWPRIADVPPRVYYLDLQRYRRYLEELEQTPFTPAVSAFFALETALDELAEQGGVPARRETYRRRNRRIRRVLIDVGFQPFTKTGRESQTICTMRVPPLVEVASLYTRMKDRGFIIYKCKGLLARDHIQVANMGELPDGIIDAFLAALVAEVLTLRTVSQGT